MPANTILRTLVPELMKVDNPPEGEPDIASREDLRDGTRSGSGSGEPGGPIVQPIQDSWSDGQTVTLSAGSYGPAPTLVMASNWENIAAGTDVGGGVSSQAGYKTGISTQYGRTGDVVVDTARAHSGSRSAKVHWGTDNIAAFGVNNLQADTNELRLLYWRYQSFVYDTTVLDANLKQFYVFGNGPGEFPQAMVLIPAGQNTWAIYNNGGVNYPGSEGLGLTDVNTQGEWQLWDIYLKNNSAQDTEDGIFRVRVNGKTRINHTGYRFQETASGNFKDIRLGHMADNANASEVWYDEVIFSEGPQAVWVSTSSQWDESVEQVLASQIATSWSDSGITFNLNTSDLPEGVDLYAFVEKADGTISAGEYIGQINPATQPTVKTITGTGFGQGPDIVLFDSFDAGTAGELVTLSGAEIGQWSQHNGDGSGFVPQTKYFMANNRLWMAGRDVDNVSVDAKHGTGLRADFAEEVTEFRLSYRLLCPDGYKFPGTTLANTTDFSGSNWKIMWMGRDEEGDAAGATQGQPDLCIPTVINGFPVAGNNLRWEYGASSRVYVNAPSAVNENLWSFYQSPESVEGARDGTIEFLQCNGDETIRVSHINADPFHEWNGDVTNESFNMLLFNGWMGNVPSYVDVLPLFADAYVAIGPNARACLITSNAETLATSTQVYMVPHTTWSDTKITYTPRDRENLPYKHLILADGTLMENVGIHDDIGGTELLLTGSGFGAISNPLPTAIDLFDEYAGAVDGATIPQGSATGAKWPGTANIQYQDGFQFDSNITLGGRPFAALAKGAKAHLDDLSTDTSTGPARRLDRFYSTHWMYLHESPYGNTHPYEYVSFKFARHWADASGTDSRDSWLFRNGLPDNAAGQIDSAGHLSPYYPGGVWNVGAWNRVEYEISDPVDNGDGTFNGNLRTWINGQATNYTRDSQGFSSTAIPVSNIRGSGWYTRLIGSDPSVRARISQSFRLSLAEVIERAGSARVELSNDPVFDDSAPQRRFCQVVDSWTDSVIRIPSVFFGDLDQSAPIYAFIIPEGGASDGVINYGRVN